MIPVKRTNCLRSSRLIVDASSCLTGMSLLVAHKMAAVERKKSAVECRIVERVARNSVVESSHRRPEMIN